ncbi:uncharacterized protein LOC107022342 [Solanum pennellii]|uniref:Uncharacterized protein LOC107022342 n=1 Tax=Solanum pennellii TaxID=28526 RepID=A0ABM1H033_SOLPN|nr:uncharacterized protein LOC107022342 [Solanum pennellii]
MDKICDLFGFKQCNSSMYYVAANGLAEAFNNTLCNLLKKVVSKSKRDWHDRMEEALWVYGTTHRTATQETPYSFVFGTEAVLSLERKIPSLRVAIQEGLTEEDNARLRLKELEVLYEKRRLADWSHQWKILEEVLSLKRRHTPGPQEYKLCTAPKKMSARLKISKKVA